MTTCYNRFACVTLVLIVFTTVVLALQTDGSHRLYLEAKKHSFNQQWDIAAQLYEQLVEEYPESHYREEAQFWVGYCLEKTGEYRSAFLAFNLLERKFPESMWLDDAIQHKIVLAEKLAARRGDQYYTFLRSQLDHEDDDIQYQAGMALGRLGDKRALAVLQSLKGRVDFDVETEQIISQLQQAKDLPDEVLYGENTIGDAIEDDKKATLRIHPKNERVNYFAEHRFDQYKAMAKKDDSWSDKELINFGLWHVLPSDSFDVYYKMEAAAQNEWLRRYWKKQDPTPTTEHNEGQEEFESRVKFARSSFSYFDGLENYNYAPWDARGEIYIKFGQPQNRTMADDGEFWYYPQHDRITFYIRPNVTNIFGRAIIISSLNGQSMRSVPRRSQWSRWRYLHTHYIFNPGFYYDCPPPDGYSYIKNLTVQTTRNSPVLVFQYSMPTSEFTFTEKDGIFQLSYLERYVVFDAHMNKVTQQENMRQLTKSNKREIKKQKTIEQEINVDLDPGDYTLGLRIEDSYSKKVGIKKLDISIE
ncbi:GWxTD domain-containing protein [candidate division KSB1 bacterium]|nr:GWxTD domain-containing protein [candidate division KSB1 bacterium]